MAAGVPAVGPAAAEDLRTADGPVEVDSAVLQWAVNEQTNARSHNPLAINFLSAGVADPGRGGAELPPERWQAVAGSVEIQKQTAAGQWATATWDGLSTDATGAPIDVYGPFSGHRVSFTAGTGTVDPATDTGSLSWRGTVTVVYYAGNTVFTLTDPTLEVTGGVGTLTADLGGWAAGRDDVSLWQPVTPARVTVADLPVVDLTEDGTVAVPAYAGVEATGTVPQHRTGEHWGSFPPSMIAALAPLGIDQFWYSTGLQADWTKTPAPVVVGYSENVPEAPAPTATPKPLPTPTNQVSKAPTASPTPASTPTPRPSTNPQPTARPQPPAETGPAAVPMTPQGPSTGPDVSAPAAVPLAAPMQVVAAQPVALAAADASTSRSAAWWAGGVLLVAAQVLLLLPAGRRPTRP